MASLTNMALAQMRAATVAQLRAAVKAKIDILSKKQIIRLELWVRQWDPATVVTIQDADTRTDWPDGQIKQRVSVMRDESGAKVGTRRVDHTYYPTGEVDEIVVTELDGADVVTSTKTIKHFTDGRQPVVS